MPRFFTVPLLIAALAAPAASGVDAAAIAITAQDEPQPDAPFRAPVTFTLQSGSDADLFWGKKGDTSFLDGVRSWQIQIFDFDGEKVDFIQGAGRPPARHEWAGTTRDGRPLRDSFYTVRFVWQDAAGVSRASLPIKVGLLTPPGLQDFIGPQVRLAYTVDGLTIRMSENLTFDAGKWQLRPDAEAVIERIAGFLRLYPNHKLMVLGHTDETGTERFNQMVSVKRSQAIYRVLLAKGIGEERMTYQGLGAARPLVSNETAEGRRQNRRVEIVLLKAVI